MINEMKKRKYRLKQRAEQQNETRDRIIQATMELHGELGPRNASISAIAERAGVQRLTVYRHFDDEVNLFHACSSRWLELNPLPEPANWMGLEEPRERIRSALRSIYDYYQSTQDMWRLVHRDIDEVPALEEPMAGVEKYLGSVRDGLVPKGSAQARRTQLAATLTHSLRFSTWESLHTGNLNNGKKVDLVMKWLEGIEPELGA